MVFAQWSPQPALNSPPATAQVQNPGQGQPFTGFLSPFNPFNPKSYPDSLYGEGPIFPLGSEVTVGNQFSAAGQFASERVTGPVGIPASPTANNNPAGGAPEGNPWASVDYSLAAGIPASTFLDIADLNAGNTYRWPHSPLIPTSADPSSGGFNSA
jgi:hypothetical protein